MIKSIYASDKRFKRIDFEPGLNIIVANKKNKSEKSSCNGLGKSTLFSIIDFCLGANLIKSLKDLKEIEHWVFYLEMTIKGKDIKISRSIQNPSQVIIENDFRGFGAVIEVNNDGRHFISNSEWLRFLGNKLFLLDNNLDGKNNPSFRSLFAFFMRKTLQGGYADPFKYQSNVNADLSKVYTAYLLGLSWACMKEIIEVKKELTIATNLKKAVSSGLLKNKGELETERVKLQKYINEQKESLSNFRVHDQYRTLEEKANKLTKDIREISDINIILRKKSDNYLESIAAETPPDTSLISQMYAEAGIYFSDKVEKKLEEVRIFHDRLVKNRSSFLEVEVKQIKNDILNGEKTIKILSDERSEVMKILESHGALEEFNALRDLCKTKEFELDNIKLKINRLDEASSIEEEASAKKISIEQRMRRDYEESRCQWEEAVSLFNENTKAIYDQEGNLTINVVKGGYKFHINIPRKDSEGVGKMKIFCYDVMLLQMFSERGGIDFLFHDSTIFDGVDERQVIKALEHAINVTSKSGSQYICSFNYDRLPGNHDDYSKYIRLELNDESEDGYLLGFTFNTESDIDA